MICYAIVIILTITFNNYIHEVWIIYLFSLTMAVVEYLC
jgi:hypothetical protein